jgi:hypothetical protein
MRSSNDRSRICSISFAQYIHTRGPAIVWDKDPGAIRQAEYHWCVGKPEITKADRKPARRGRGPGIDFRADEYEENRHFLLGQYFRENYNKVLSTLPAVTTPVQILRLDVWVTNKNGSTVNTRDVVGFMDLAERNPYLSSIVASGSLPDNNTNDLYQRLISNPANRNPALGDKQFTGTRAIACAGFRKDICTQTGFRRSIFSTGRPAIFL